jgi:titin
MTRKARFWWRRWLDRFYPASRPQRRARQGQGRPRPLLEALEERWLLAVNYLVTSTLDDGSFGTLRDAITQLNANNAAYTNEIDFNISGAGVHTISVGSFGLGALPTITRSGITINGLTQPGSSTTTPLIQLNGAGAGPSANGLDTQATFGSYNGLIISGFSRDGILAESTATSTWVSNCFIGTDASGTVAQGNGNYGVELASKDNIIGINGVFAGGRDIISGNLEGIQIDSGSTGTQILGNYIGTNAAGTAAVANNFVGIEDDGSNNIIGGSIGRGNVLSGNINYNLYLSQASGDQVLGNSIGTNAAGTAAVPAVLQGVYLYQATNNTIGGTTASVRNIISGNGGDGILMDTGSSGNQVLGNYIGLSSSAGALGNSGNGIEIADANNSLGGTAAGVGNNISNNGADGILLGSSASGNLVEGNNILSNTGNGVESSSVYNTIGFTVTAARNIISLNGKNGVLLNAGASGNLVIGDFIGVGPTGASASPNGANGVEVAGDGNVIGYLLGPRTVISANAGDGILIDSGASGNAILGNNIGTNFLNSAALPNSGNGIEIFGSANSIGFAISGGRNVVAGNANDGILLGISASGNLLQGNFIGTNGAAVIANSGNGVEVLGTGNTIGTTLTWLNVISGNAGDGVVFDSGSAGNVLQSSLIGTNSAGKAALANGANGVEVLGSNNTVGGSSLAVRNVISGNAQDGVLIGSGVSGVGVQANYIGTDVNGSAALGNVVNGVEVLGTGNTIGGTSSTKRNVIAANLSDGVLIDSGATGNIVQGAYIGINASGTAALGNTVNGVEVDGANNTVGGTISTARNVISSNLLDGVFIATGASGVVVQGNYIGTNNAGSAALGNGTGVEVGGNAATIGGTTALARNVISGNTGDGVDIDAGVSGTVVQGNYIGTNATASAALGNSSVGITISGNHTLVGGTSTAAANIIADNGVEGIHISAGSANTVRHNSIYANGPSNTGPGIVLAAGANNNIAAPTISTVTLSGTILTVNGSFSAPTANVPYVLEFFVSPAGDPEGKIYIGSKTVTPTATGTQAFTFKTSTAAATNTTLITATLTDNLGDTSIFSNAVTS